MKAGTISLLKTVVFIAMAGAILFISQWVFPIVGGWFTFFAIVLLLVLAIFLMAGLGWLLGDKKPRGEERPEERGKKEKEPMKRGWILFWSFVLEASVMAALLLPAPFILPWSPTAGLIFTIVVGAVAALVVLGLGFLLVYFWWAPNNLFFTFVPEGWAKIVVRGYALEEVLIQWAGRSLAKTAVLADPDVEGSTAINIGDIVEGGFKRWFGGLCFYGFWPVCDIFVYDFGWTNITLDGEIQAHPKQPMDRVLLKDDVYYAEVKMAEDINLLPLNVGLVLRLRVANPAKAIFQVENWLETVVNLVEPAVRYVISTDTYKNWIRLPKDLGDEIFEKLAKEGLIEELRSRYGVEMVSFGVKAFDTSLLSETDGARQATLKQYFAEMEAEKIVTEATARATEARLLGEGEAAGIKATLALGPEAVALRTMEVAAKPGNLIVMSSDGKMPPVILQSPGARAPNP